MNSGIKNQINSVFVHVSDLNQSAKWYSDLLGLELKEERLNGGPVYWMELDGYTGILLDDNSVNKQREGWDMDLVPQYMYVAHNVQSAYEQLKQNGFRITLDIETPHEGLTFFNSVDPDGNVFMVCNADDEAEPLNRVVQVPIKHTIPAVFVNVTQMQKAANWYFTLLGMEQQAVDTKETIVEISSAKGADVLLDSNRYLQGEEYKILFMFDTEDIDAAYEYVRKKSDSCFYRD